MNLPRLLVLTDRTQVPPERTLIDQVRQCRDAGATHVVLREVDLPGDARTALAADLADLELVVIAARHSVRGAAGVHERSAGEVNGLVDRSQQLEPFAVAPARGSTRQAARTFLWGRSCHTPAEVARAAADGCTYATLGPFAPTVSKPGYGPAIAASAYADLPIPTYALGGITPDNAAAAINAGAYGVAVMGALMRSPDPGRMVRDLLEAI